MRIFLESELKGRRLKFAQLEYFSGAMNRKRRVELEIRNHKDFASGLFYAVVGVGFSYVSTSYTMGTAAKMGPGYFPFWLGIILTLLGLMVIAGSVSPKAEPDKLDRWDVKTLLWILGSVVMFGLLLYPLGLLISLPILVIVSSMASHEFDFKWAAVNALVLTALSYGAFVYGLNLQFPLWPAFMAH